MSCTSASYDPFAGFKTMIRAHSKTQIPIVSLCIISNEQTSNQADIVDCAMNLQVPPEINWAPLFNHCFDNATSLWVIINSLDFKPLIQSFVSSRVTTNVTNEMMRLAVDGWKQVEWCPLHHEKCLPCSRQKLITLLARSTRLDSKNEISCSMCSLKSWMPETANFLGI